MPVKFNQDEQLKCPICGDGYLHQSLVEVYQRDGEDAPKGFAVSVDYPSMKLETSQAENPSRRRSGIRIYFLCENCEERYEGNNYPLMSLIIIQNKGNTYIEWEDLCR